MVAGSWLWVQGFAADPVYVKGEVFTYFGRNQNLKDLKGDPSIASVKAAFAPDFACHCRPQTLQGYHAHKKHPPRRTLQ